MADTETDKELEHLVDMANDIAMNFAFHDNGAERIADHLNRFWAPSMKRRLAEHVAAGGQGLADAAIEAVKRLSQS